MKKTTLKKYIRLTSSILISAALLINTSYWSSGAWIYSESNGESGSESIGIIRIGSLGTEDGVYQSNGVNLDSPLVAGDNMTLDFTAQNAGNAEAWFRFKVELLGPAASSVEPDLINSLETEFPHRDGTYFYIGSIEGGESLNINVDFTLSTSISNEYQGTTIEFKIILQAVQRANNSENCNENGKTADWPFGVEVEEIIAGFTVDPNNPSTILSYDGDDEFIIIPEQINGVTITGIGSGVFDGKNISGLTLPETIETIGDNAFRNNNISEIVLPESLEYIGAGAFENNDLTSIAIPGQITEIYDRTFKNNNIETVTFSDGIEYIGNQAFRDNNIETLIFPDSIISVSVNSFRDNLITYVVIPEYVTNLSANVFFNNDIETVFVYSPEIAGTIQNQNSHGQLFGNIIEGGVLYFPEEIETIGNYVLNNFTLDSIETIDGQNYKKYIKN